MCSLRINDCLHELQSNSCTTANFVLGLILLRSGHRDIADVAMTLIWALVVKVWVPIRRDYLEGIARMWGGGDQLTTSSVTNSLETGFNVSSCGGRWSPRPHPQSTLGHFGGGLVGAANRLPKMSLLWFLTCDMLGEVFPAAAGTFFFSASIWPLAETYAPWRMRFGLIIYIYIHICIYIYIYTCTAQAPALLKQVIQFLNIYIYIYIGGAGRSALWKSINFQEMLQFREARPSHCQGGLLHCFEEASW